MTVPERSGEDVLTLEQIAELQEAYELFDEDGDGALQIAEIKNLLVKMNHIPTTAELKQIEALDLNGDGQCEFSEFVEMFGAKIMAARGPEKAFADAFDLLDDNDSGGINRGELTYLLTKLSQLMKALGQSVLSEKQLDVAIEALKVSTSTTDGDGGADGDCKTDDLSDEVSFEEFKKILGLVPVEEKLHKWQNDSQLSFEQIADLKEAFDMFDINGDGILCIAEIEEVLKKLGHNPTKEELNQMFSIVDDDGSNEIDFDEFVKLMGTRMSNQQGDEENPDVELKRAFEMFDEDGSGFIDRSELAILMKKLGQELNDNEVDAMMVAVDTNRDGFISFDEFKEVMGMAGISSDKLLSKDIAASNEEEKLSEDQIAQLKEAFQMFDVNGDGTLEIDEIRQVMNKLGQYHTEEELKEIIATVDKDGNSEIDFDEFCVMMAPKLLSDDPERELKKAFAGFDSDGSGAIDRSEFSLLMKQFGQDLTDEQLDELMKTVDEDGDGEVSYEEFRSILGLAQKKEKRDRKQRKKKRKKPKKDDDIATNSELPKELIAEIKAAFDMFDANGDGTLEVDEIKQIMRQLGNEMPDEEMDIMFASIDKDGNNEIDFEELIEFVESSGEKLLPTGPKDPDKELKDAFAFFDSDGSGSIDRTELSALMTRLGQELDDSQLDALMKTVDEDGGGDISFEEFKGILEIMKKKNEKKKRITSAEIKKSNKETLQSFYEENNPEKLEVVDLLLKKHAGKEELIIEQMEDKYGFAPKGLFNSVTRKKIATSLYASGCTNKDFNKKRLIALFEKHDVDRVKNVDKVLIKFDGDECALFEKLEDKYGENPTAVWLTAFYTKYNQDCVFSVPEKMEEYKGREEELFIKLTTEYNDPKLTVASRYISGSTNKDFIAKRFIAVYQKHDPDRLENVNELLKKYEGDECTMLQDLEDKYGENPTVVWVTAFYTKYKPEAVSSVDKMMSKFKGKEGIMFTKLTAKYNDPAIVYDNLCKNNGIGDSEQECKEEVPIP